MLERNLENTEWQMKLVLHRITVADKSQRTQIILLHICRIKNKIYKNIIL